MEKHNRINAEEQRRESARMYNNALRSNQKANLKQVQQDLWDYAAQVRTAKNRFMNESLTDLKVKKFVH